MDNANQIFQEYLLSDEHILWSGQSEKKVNFTTIDFFLVPFSLMWGGFAIFWETTAIIMIPKNAPGGIGIIFPLFGIPFVIVGLYFILGRFIFKKWQKSKTFYAVTNRRILSLRKVFGQHFLEANIASLSGISKNVRSDGIGTLTFNAPSKLLGFFGGNNFYANTGMDILPSFDQKLGFFDIANADQVYKIIMDIKTKGV